MIDFELIVPDGWVVLPTTPESTRLRTAAIDAIIRTFLPDSMPRDSAGPWRRELRKQLLAATDDACRNGARSVLLPLSRFNGRRIPGSMIMTVMEDEARPAQDPEQLLASILADAGSDGAFREIGGASAVRVASVVRAPALGRDALGRRVGYYLAHPERPGVWGLLTFTVLAEGDTVEDPDVQAVELLFDSIVSTVRWADRDAVPTEDEILASLAPAA
ncbi:MAG TPA: hypothetical protein VGM10_04845 [Actinocrinis sp.]